jgi:hypothetical protein
VRRLHANEKPLVAYLLNHAGINADVGSLQVKPMDDGGMGSLRFHSDTPNARFGKEVAGCRFDDSDGTEVWATLNLDQNGCLFELDVWKVDFSPLGKWPEENDIREEPANKGLH